MSKTIAARTELQRLFKTLTTNVYYETASDKTAFPRIVHELSELSFDSGRTVLQMEVNVVDYSKNTNAADTLADAVQEALNKYFYVGTEVVFSVYKGARQNIQEDDERIIRRRLLFEVHLHEVKEES